MSSAFPQDQHLTAIAIAYKNPDVALIADAVLPRDQVGKTEFVWWEYAAGDQYTVPSTKVGPKSKINRVEVSGTKKTDATEDFGIEIPLSNDEINNAPKGVDPKEKATERATNIVLLDREIRVAQMLFDASLYPASNKVTLSGTSQWSDTANSDPIKAIRAKLSACLVRPNVIAFGQEVWDTVAMHPKVVSAAIGNAGQAGVASKQRVAELLEVQEVLVGAGWYNASKPGAAVSLARCWGKHALAFYRDRTAGSSGGLTFGWTAQYGSRIAGSKPEDMGLRGGIVVRSGESVREVVAATQASFFFENAVA